MCLPLSSLMHSLSKKSVSAFDSSIVSTSVELEKIVLTTTKHFYSGKNTLWISDQLEDNIGIDLGGLMKLNTPFTSLKNAISDIWRMNDFNYKLPKEEKQDYWKKRMYRSSHYFSLQSLLIYWPYLLLLLS